MSTDKQSSDSPADQIARCRAFAAQRGLEVVESLVASDAGISGASRHNRPALLALFDRIAEWDMLLCWDSSRLARDSEDLGWIRNRLRAHRRTGYEVSTGLDLFNVGAKVLGVMAEEYLVKLRADTQRGLKGRAERGLSTGGLAYGYRSEPVALDEHGRAVESAGFRVVVDEAAAEIVRSIFAQYLAGAGLREIAHRLNADGAPPPRPRARAKRRASWAPTSLREMLRNPLYRGERIFNRTEWIKDHATGTRRRFERPPEEWVREDRPDLAIVDRGLFDAVQAETRRRTTDYPRSADGRRLAGRVVGKGRSKQPRHVLSGFLACGECGGSYCAQNTAERYGCSWHRQRGPNVCPSDLVVPRLELEGRIFGAIRERILVPETIDYIVESAIAYASELLAPERPDPARAARLIEIDDELAMLSHGRARQSGAACRATRRRPRARAR
jgi:site-specific DNA recombinase